MFEQTKVIIAAVILCLCVKYFGNEKEIELNPKDTPSLKSHAESGNPKAQLYLAIKYSEGNGIKKDEEEAFKWFRKAAEQGNALAQSSLAWSYMDGRGVDQDSQKAKKWWIKSAKNGNDISQFALGEWYATEDLVKSYAWYSCSSFEEADKALLEISKDMSEAEIEEAKALARSFFPGTTRGTIGWYSFLTFIGLFPLMIICPAVSNEKLRNIGYVIGTLAALFLVGAGLYLLIGWEGVFSDAGKAAAGRPRRGIIVLIIELWPYVITVFGCWLIDTFLFYLDLDFWRSIKMILRSKNTPVE